jgi:hypothetical protein
MKRLFIVLMICAVSLVYGESEGDIATYNEEPLVLSLGFGAANFPHLDEDSLVKVQLGMGSRAPRFNGVQASILYSVSNDDSKGAQFSTLTNVSTANFKGVQASVLSNITTGTMSGYQGSAVYSYAGAAEGLQFSTINETGSLSGVQIGLINFGGNADGVQVGLINVADNMDGLAVGLVNISKNGIVDTGVWYEASDTSMAYSYFQSGNDTFYTLLFIGDQVAHPFEGGDHIISGFHLGHRTNIGPAAWDIDAGLKTPNLSDEFALYPSFRTVLQLNIKNLGLFCGLDGVVSYPDAADTTLFEGNSFDLMGDEDFKVYTNFIAGVSLKLAGGK